MPTAPTAHTPVPPPTANAQRHTPAVFERSQIIMAADAGLVDYQAAAAWQTERVDAVARGDAPEIVLILQHPPVYTLGRRGNRKYLLADEADLRRRGAAVVESDRGGDITFHGPGQLILWPILRLRERGIGVVEHVRRLEATAIDTAAALGVAAQRIKGRPGVWTVSGAPDSAAIPAKLASLGIRVHRGVSSHGIALNVDSDLAWFDHIVACGLEDADVTSLSDASGGAVSCNQVAPLLCDTFARVYGLRLSPARVAIGKRP